MPVSYSFDGSIVLLQMVGHYSVGELKDCLLEALDAPGCPTDAVLFFDLRESASMPDRTAAEVRNTAEFIAARGARFSNRLAMVTSTDLAYGLMRLAAAIAENSGVTPAVFRDFDQARRWVIEEGD